MTGQKIQQERDHCFCSDGNIRSHRNNRNKGRYSCLTWQGKIGYTCLCICTCTTNLKGIIVLVRAATASNIEYSRNKGKCSCLTWQDRIYNWYTWLGVWTTLLKGIKTRLGSQFYFVFFMYKMVYLRILNDFSNISMLEVNLKERYRGKNSL